MKLTAVLILAFTLQLNAKTYSQKISISEKNISLSRVFRLIEKQTGYSFIYENKALRKAKLVSLSIRNTDLTEALNICFKEQPLVYEIKYNTVIIREKEIADKITTGEKEDNPAIPPLVTVKGSVTNEKGQPLAGATITIKGTSQSIVSDNDGSYSITVPSARSVLVFSYVGFVTAEKIVGNAATINIKLIAELKDMNEVVVIGYGTQRKQDVTGAVGTVNIDKAMTAKPVTNVQELLAGTVPGLNISKSSGAVGSGASINIRGVSTIGGSSGVLILIDGFPGNIYTLNPNDIESISVLKDAASASIYGSRAANGVLLITTKKGTSSAKPVVEFNSNIGLQQTQFALDFVGSSDFMKLWDQALENDGKSALYGAQGQEDLKNGKYPDNKWYIDIYKKKALMTNQAISVSGGNEAITYRLSGSYDYQNGTLPENNYKKYVIRPDMTIRISSKITAGINLQYTETDILQPQGGTEIWQSQAARAAPISPIYTKNGQYAIGSSMVGNTIAGLNEGGDNISKYKELFGVLDLVYTPLKNWNIRGSLARYSFQQRTTDRVLPYNLYDDGGNVVAQKNIVSSITESFSGNARTTLQLTTDYSKSINRHHFKVLAGYSQEYFKTEGFNAFRDNLPFNDIDVLDVGSKLNMQNGGAASDVAIQSFFGRLNYDYDGRYLLQANLRADGSSRFAPGHRWGVFPSFSAGWNINKESFFNVDVISQLKIRASWGILGDAEKVGYYPTAEVITYNPGMYGFDGSVVPGAYNSIAVNRNITWERAKQSDIGIDLGLFRQKLTLSADYFYNKRDNILYAPPVPVEFGIAGPVMNLLKMDNAGWEFLLGYHDNTRDFSWGLNVNTSFSKNKVTDLAGTGPWISGNTYTDVGTQYQLPYGLVATGLFMSDDDVKSINQGTNVFPGNIKYKDLDGNKLIDGNDRTILNNKIPMRYGADISFGWKQFDLFANFYGTLNNYRYISGYEGWAFYLSQNVRPWALDNWTPENLDATYPRLSIQYTSNDTKYSSFWLRKASYLKIQNVQLGYTIPASVLSRTKIRHFRIYVSAQNLATITQYPGFDPEGNYYPLSRTYSFGINLKF